MMTAASATRMKCTLSDCSGTYEERLITHTVRWEGRLVVFDHVPAEVCTTCGDVLLHPETLRHIEVALTSRKAPASTAPVYEYA